MTLGWWFKSDYGSLDLELFHVYRSSQDFTSRSTMNSKPKAKFSSSWTTLITALTPLSILITTPILAWQLSGLLGAWDPNIPIVFKDPQLAVVVSTKFWTTKKSNHRVLQEFWVCPHKFISQLWRNLCPLDQGGWAGLTWQIHSIIPISLSLWIYSSREY